MQRVERRVIVVVVVVDKSYVMIVVCFVVGKEPNISYPLVQLLSCFNKITFFVVYIGLLA